MCPKQIKHYYPYFLRAQINNSLYIFKNWNFHPLKNSKHIKLPTLNIFWRREWRWRNTDGWTWGRKLQSWNYLSGAQGQEYWPKGWDARVASVSRMADGTESILERKRWEEEIEVSIWTVKSWEQEHFSSKLRSKSEFFSLEKQKTISISVNCLERMSLCCLEQVKFCIQNLCICPHLEKGPLQMRLIILRWGHPWLSDWAPNPLRNILIKREDTVTEE